MNEAQGLRPRGCSSAEEKGATRMGKHASTCKTMFPFRDVCPGPMEKQFPSGTEVLRPPSSSPPPAGNCLSPGEHASSDLCRGDKHASLRGLLVGGADVLSTTLCGLVAQGHCV